MTKLNTITIASIPKTFDTLTQIIQQAEKMNKKILFSHQDFTHFDKIADFFNLNYERKIIFLENFSQRLNYIDSHFFIANFYLESAFQDDEYCFIPLDRLFYPKSAKNNANAIVNLISEMQNFALNDLVIHKKYGLGRFLGMTKISFAGLHHDCVKLEYANEDKLIVPIETIDQISKYKNGDCDQVQLDSLKSDAWQKRKRRVRNKIQELANKIIETAAKREILDAEVFAVNDKRKEIDEFYRTFPFVETADQLRAIQDIECDLSSKQRPMNRLLCGDVGFGKTEVALRAAFIVCALKKEAQVNQVVLVAPTTFLVKQHFLTFKQRLKDYNIKIEMLSRLLSANKKKVILERLKVGDIDILISTHAAFGSVEFNNLSLIIIDEEQSFGVDQKEKLKSKWSKCHFLQMSATPIPRTLQASLYGIIDTSIIATAPFNRKPVKSYVIHFNSEIIKDAIDKELKRCGKVAILTPKIEDMHELALKVKNLDTQAKILTLHGQMSSDYIDESMVKFELGEYNLVIATTILAQGMNIKDLNTIIINNADLFGMGQLYQIKGRVGRSKQQGYAYFLVNKKRLENESVIRKLKILENSALSGGFGVANADLDIRGGGNILGKEQSGSIKEIGFDLYQDMLQQAIDSAKNSSNKQGFEDDNFMPEIDTGKSIYIPDDYVKNPTVRIAIYRKISKITSSEEWHEFRDEMLDRFGKIPEELENLIEIINLRSFCIKEKIKNIRFHKTSIAIEFLETAKIDGLKVINLTKVRKDISIKGNNKIVIEEKNFVIEKTLNNLEKVINQIKAN
jgi:transcription-repair coupling factor (superfamily II helicase)